MACCGNHGPPAACSTAQTGKCPSLQAVPVVGFRIATCQLLSRDAPRAGLQRHAAATRTPMALHSTGRGWISPCCWDPAQGLQMFPGQVRKLNACTTCGHASCPCHYQVAWAGRAEHDPASPLLLSHTLCVPTLLHLHTAGTTGALFGPVGARPRG